MGLKLHSRLKFRMVHGYFPDLKNPRSLSEKIHWIKIHCDLEPLAPFVDKYSVRDYVRERVGEKYLIPLIGLYRSFEEIDLSGLPSSFVMKATHGCGWNLLIEDKNRVDWNAAGKIMAVWLKTDFSRINYETCYRNIPGRILIEDYIRDPSGDLRNYKFFCSAGIPRGVKVGIDYFGSHQSRVYDAEWNEFPKEKNSPIPVAEVPKPKKLDELLDVCRRLSAGFPFVRVDLYYTDERILFGELTFTPSNGLSAFDPVRSDFYFGRDFDVRNYSINPVHIHEKLRS